MHTPFPLLFPPSPHLEASVIIPARDESVALEATLDSFLVQRDLEGAALDPARFEILLLANNCRDQTAQVAREWAKRHASIRLHVIEAGFSAEDACVGHARRLLMDAACARLTTAHHAPELRSDKTLSRKPRAICSTDADTHVSPFWIAHTLAEMSAGAQAVGGRIFLRREGDEASRRTYLFDTAYRLLRARVERMLDPRWGDPYPCHFQFFGASLAICPEIYAQIGGLPRVRFLEDVALERRLESLDIAVRHSPHVAVTTSARRCGRVETGLSTQLEEWGELENNRKCWLVPSGDEIEFKAHLKRRLRAYWSSLSASDSADGMEEAELAAITSGCPFELKKQVEAAAYFGGLWEEFWSDTRENPAFRARFAPVPVESALRQLRQILHGVHEKR